MQGRPRPSTAGNLRSASATYATVDAALSPSMADMNAALAASAAAQQQQQQHSQLAQSSAMSGAYGSSPKAGSSSNNALSIAAMGERIQDDIKKKTRETNQKFDSAASEYLKLEQNLALEARRRAEGDSNIETRLEQVFSKVSSDIESALTQRLDQITKNISIVEAKMDQMSEGVTNDRAATEKVLQELRDGNAKALAEVQDDLAKERSLRLDNEVDTLQIIKSEIAKMHERLTIEGQVREKMGLSLNDAVGKIKYSADEESMDRVKVSMIEEVEGLKTAIAVEIEARRKSEENYAKTMEVLIGQIDVGMRKLHKQS